MPEVALARSSLLCPLPLRERATRYFGNLAWVRGTPHPVEFVETAAMPSPSRGEGTNGLHRASGGME